MSTIHKFTGQWGTQLTWSGASTRSYDNDAAANVTETWLIGKAEQAKNFAIRYYEIEAGGHSRLEQHAHDHGIILLRGAGQVLLDGDLTDVTQGDVIFISPNALHQIINTGQESLGFICVIPAVRMKNNQPVWAEEGITFNGGTS